MEPNAVVGNWLEMSWLLGIGTAGLILVVLSLRRDDIVGTIFLVVGIALGAIGFGSHFLGWEIL